MEIVEINAEDYNHIKRISSQREYRHMSSTTLPKRAKELGITPAQANRYAAAMDDAQICTIGELLVRFEALSGTGCPRCDMEIAIETIFMSAIHIEESEHTGNLTKLEAEIFKLCNEWLADNTIEQCLNPDEE